MKSVLTALAAAVLCSAASAQPYNILFIGGQEQGHSYSIQCRNDLTSLGHSVTLVTNPQSLATYLQYDQVWDFRYNTNMTAQDATDMGDYLKAGGRMLVLGEHSGFESPRNISLRNWINQVGGGTIGNFVQGCATDFELTTAQGAVVMSPNALTGLQTNCATTYSQTGTGFKVVDSGNGDGCVIAWDFGDLVGKPNARLIAAWDIELWQSDFSQHKPWTENCAIYLGRVPTPGTASLLGVAALAASRRRRA